MGTLPEIQAEKHLHMRGADPKSKPLLMRSVETSPHAWSRPLNTPTIRMLFGNISTCVEQTSASYRPSCLRQKHLHMRGADFGQRDKSRCPIETSPHAWSRPKRQQVACHAARNISTCVEQTLKGALIATSWQKHLHMRGADPFQQVPNVKDQETSPHAWSRQRHLVVQLFI